MSTWGVRKYRGVSALGSIVACVVRCCHGSVRVWSVLLLWAELFLYFERADMGIWWVGRLVLAVVGWVVLVGFGRCGCNVGLWLIFCPL